MRLLNFLLALLAAVLGTSCIAAFWSLLALRGAGMLVLAPVVAAAIVLLLRFNGQPAGPWRALAAGLLFAGAALYAAYIEASGSIGAELGLSLLESLRQIGPEMAVAWWLAHHGWADALWYAAGLLVALGLAWRWGLSTAPAARRARMATRRR